MKVALALMALLLGGLLLVISRKGLWGPWWEATQEQGLALAPLLVVAVLVAASVQVLVPDDLVQRWLGQSSGGRGVLLAWLGGIVTPGAGPVGLPLVAALSRKGASLPVLLTYLLSMSTLSLVRIPIEWGLIGGRLALIRLAASFFIPPAVGAVALALVRLAK